MFITDALIFLTCAAAMWPLLSLVDRIGGRK